MKNIKGFTLIELAMVLFIMALLLVGFLTPLAERIRQTEINQTESQMEAIKEALYGFAVKEGRLPCPDNDNDGNEDPQIVPGDGQNCNAVTGNLPWVTLGVAEFDIWGNRFIYRVTDDFADGIDGAATGCPASVTITLNISFSLCSDGDITVQDASGGADVATLIPALVVSSGSNWTETPSAHETENTNGDAIFVDKDFSEDAVLQFDDQLIWLSPHILMNRMVISGQLP